MRKLVAGTPADPTITFTKLVLDEGEFDLVLRFEDFARAEKELGEPLLSGLAAFMNGNAGFVHYRQLLYAATRTAHPKLSVEEIEGLCDILNLVKIKGAIAKAYVESIPEKKREEYAKILGLEISEA